MEIKILVGISIIIKTYMCSCYNFLILVKAKKDRHQTAKARPKDAAKRGRR